MITIISNLNRIGNKPRIPTSPPSAEDEGDVSDKVSKDFALHLPSLTKHRQQVVPVELGIQPAAGRMVKLKISLNESQSVPSHAGIQNKIVWRQRTVKLPNSTFPLFMRCSINFVEFCTLRRSHFQVYFTNSGDSLMDKQHGSNRNTCLIDYLWRKTKNFRITIPRMG